MEAEAVELVRGVYDRWAQGDFATGDAFSSDIVFDRVGHDITGEIQGPFHGSGEMARATRAWLSAWDHFTIEADEMIDLGDRLLVLTRWGGRGRDSGVPFEEREGGDLWTVRDGKVIELTMWYSREEALAAVEVER